MYGGFSSEWQLTGRRKVEGVALQKQGYVVEVLDLMRLS